jgi:hypothetical protein
MILEAVFDDGSSILGVRDWKTRKDECWGTHHIRVISSSITGLIGKEIAIPVNKPRYWIIHKNSAAL